MSETTICLKQYVNKEDCRKINVLKNICTDEENIFLKLELEFKLNMSQMHKEESFEYINEFLYYSGETLIGYLGIFSFGGETGELTGMVHPQCRRKGIFKKLYSLALAECKRRNFKKTLLVCDNRSASGLSFIKTAGAAYAFSEYEMKLDSNYASEGEKDIVLRKAKNSDADEIAGQNCIYFGDSSRAVIMPEDEEKRNRITYMLELGSRVIGKIRTETNADEGFISGFGILPEYRRKGYGKQALKAALYMFNRDNIHNAALEVAAENKNALNLYKSCGFAEESVTDYYEVKAEEL
jgi:ribosomal protein S18 acetylase RimI-like enzyme